MSTIEIVRYSFKVGFSCFLTSRSPPTFRRLISEALNSEPRIFAIADELAAELFADGSPADLVERYARKPPLSVIRELLVCHALTGPGSSPGRKASLTSPAWSAFCA
jgi:hypothetical protein